VLRQAGAAAAAVVVLAGCSAESGDRSLPAGPGGGVPSATATSSAPGSPTAAAPSGVTELTKGSVRLTIRPQDAAQRPVLESYLGFFAAYAAALDKADPRSALLRRHTSPAAFADFSRGLAENARIGTTVRGPVILRPAVQKTGSGALTVLVVDCLDASGQRFHDRAGRPTGEAGQRRSIQVELVNSPGPVRWVVGSLADGPPTACERSGS
jgi:hypothetical protein